MNNIVDLTVNEMKEKLKNKELTVTEITKAYVDRINEKEKDVQAFVTLLTDEAISQAEKIQEGIERGEIKQEFAGIPIGIKDNLCTKGIKTTCSSKMLENFVSPYDATVIEKLNNEKMIDLGKLNMDEFAMGGSTETSYFKKTKNPWNLSKVPGGSSGGSAAAVASNMVPWALGSDTGGSIRQPASFCGVVGLKPTYGLVSRYGLVAFASSLDQIGPITKDVKDCAMLLNLIAGADAKDTTSVEQPKKDYVKALTGDIKGLKIGVPKEFFGEGINSEVKESLEKAIEIYKNMDIFVMPSKHETFGLVYVEAMSQGLPVIYTRNEGFDQFFEDGVVGYSMKYNDYRKMSENIENIFNNYSMISKNCIEKSIEFDWNKIARKYIQIYNEIK